LPKYLIKIIFGNPVFFGFTGSDELLAKRGNIARHLKEIGNKRKYLT
jgi:hypothetical protein